MYSRNNVCLIVSSDHTLPLRNFLIDLLSEYTKTDLLELLLYARQ